MRTFFTPAVIVEVAAVRLGDSPRSPREASGVPRLVKVERPADGGTDTMVTSEDEDLEEMGWSLHCGVSEET